MPAQLSERPTAATEEAAPPWPAWPPTAAEHRDQSAGPPPPPERPAADGTGGRRWSWPRRLSTAVVALAIALTGGMAGAYTATRLDDVRVVTTPAAATVATTGAVKASTSLTSRRSRAAWCRSPCRAPAGEVGGSCPRRADPDQQPHVAGAGQNGRIQIQLSDGRRRARPSQDPATTWPCSGPTVLTAATFGDSNALEWRHRADRRPPRLEGSVTGIAAHCTVAPISATASRGAITDAIRPSASTPAPGGPIVNTAGQASHSPRQLGQDAGASGSASPSPASRQGFGVPLTGERALATSSTTADDTPPGPPDHLDRRAGVPASPSRRYS